MSFLDDVKEGLEKASPIITELSPWWPVIKPLLEGLKSGTVTEDDVNLLVEGGMLRAKRKQISSE